MRALLFSLVCAGCATQSGAPAACEASTYPCGAVGFGVGSVIRNAELRGRRDANRNDNPLDDAVGPIRLGDYHDDAGLHVLVLALSAVWCIPCRNEQPELAAMHRDYAGRPVAFLQVLIQNQPGQVADDTAVDQWATTYLVPFDIAGDPNAALDGYYQPTVFPQQIVVTTADMKIRFLDVAEAGTNLRAAVDAAL